MVYQIGINFSHSDNVSSGLHEGSNGTDRDTFTNSTGTGTADKNVLDVSVSSVGSFQIFHFFRYVMI